MHTLGRLDERRGGALQDQRVPPLDHFVSHHAVEAIWSRNRRILWVCGGKHTSNHTESDTCALLTIMRFVQRHVQIPAIVFGFVRHRSSGERGGCPSRKVFSFVGSSERDGKTPEKESDTEVKEQGVAGRAHEAQGGRQVR